MKEAKNKEAVLREKVQQYFNQKVREKFYRIEGVPQGGFNFHEAVFNYSDEEVERVKQLLSDALVQHLNLPARFYSLAEIKEKVKLYELKGLNEELDEQLFTPCEENYFMDVIDVDFEHPVYYYSMSTVLYNVSEQKTIGPVPFQIILTDEEYLYLLTEQLMYRDCFTFNRLQVKNPDLAAKITESTEKSYLGFLSMHHLPYLVLMDEVREDIEKWEGPAPFHVRLYGKDEIDRATYITAFVESRQVRIVLERMEYRVNISVFERLEDISADELMARLGAGNYDEMMKMFKRRFRGKKTLRSIREFLKMEKIAFKEDSFEVDFGE